MLQSSAVIDDIPPDRLPRLLDMADVAERMGLGVQTVRDLHRRGELPVEVLRIGRRLKVRSTELERFLAGESV